MTDTSGGDGRGGTLDWIEADLLQTRGYDPATGRRPRVRAEAMVAAGFRHLTSRNQDPQLHTHCIVANMTRIEVNFGVHRGGRDAAMTEVVADHLHGQTLIEEMLGGGMA